MSGIKGANAGEKCARYYEPDKGGCYVEYKKDKIEKLEKDKTM